jgi:hypothetical protein
MVDITPHALANAVMGKLYDALTTGDGTVPPSADNFISWVTPAYPFMPPDFDFLVQGLTGVIPAGGRRPGPAELEKLLAQDTIRVYQQAEQFAQLVDFIPEVTQLNNNQFAQFNAASNEGTLSRRYELILKTSQVMEQELDAATQAKIARFRALLQTTTRHTDLVTGEQARVTGPSPMVQAYNAKMMAYNAATLAYNAARIGALAGNDPASVRYWEMNAPILRNQVTAAMNDWIANGYKNDYEEIAAYINQVKQRDMSLLKQEHEDDLGKAALTGVSSGRTFYYTSLAPGDFASSPAWTKFTFSIGDVRTYSGTEYDASGWSVSVGASYLGIFGAEGTAANTSTSSQFNESMSLDSFDLSFEIIELPIVRSNWFEEAYITAGYWRFPPDNPQFKGAMVSDGGSPPAGMIPAYPTAAIFIRSLQLGIRQDSAAGQWIDKQQSSTRSGGGYVAFGPFFLGGTASHYSSSGYSQSSYGYTWNDQGMSVDGMQLTAFRCHVFPKCPNPDPSITNWV